LPAIIPIPASLQAPIVFARIPQRSQSSCTIGVQNQPAFPLFWFTIPEGFYALVTRHGAHQDYVDSKGKKSPVWPSGLHLGPPWLKVSHLVTKQAILFNTQIKGCKTKDNVTAFIDVSIILRVMGDDPEKTPGDDR